MKSSLPKRFLVENQIYFDTSSINKLIEEPINNCIATQHLWAKKGRRMCLSPINLYEIFQNSSMERREKILYKMGVLFYGNSGYLDTPTRILFGEILGHFTDNLTQFEKSLRDSWFNIKRDPENQTFILDYEDFKKRRENLRFFTKSIKFILRDEFVNLNKDEIFNLRNSIDIIVYLISMAIKKILSKFTDIIPNRENHIKILLIYLFFCFGVEPQSDFLEKYWNLKEDGRNKIKGTLDRAIFLINLYQDELFNSHIINLMTNFILYESTNKGINRGTLSDSFHLIYSYYCFYFVTDDKSILDFSKAEKVLKSRVISVKNDFIFRKDNL